MSERIPVANGDAVAKSDLLRQAGVHGLTWLASFGLFAAADSWSELTGLAIANILAIIAGLLAGAASTTILHEWSHLAGAYVSGADYRVRAKPGVFVFDWDFERNSANKFLTMSRAGTLGSLLAVVLLWLAIPTDTSGRTALLAAAVGSTVYALRIEWPVIRRTQISGNPLAELSRIDASVLRRAGLEGLAAVLISSWLIF